MPVNKIPEFKAFDLETEWIKAENQLMAMGVRSSLAIQVDFTMGASHAATHYSKNFDDIKNLLNDVVVHLEQSQAERAAPEPKKRKFRFPFDKR